ncbi:unnamed protein product [Pleuronectes platessa]|uniref:Uncharacterized protein n=1 Tax=Pleuronectes platessa TaxID=8262 RepID=A0A9N7VNF2_PLEPL|nr:unnamed protein product [Pleuronectes platessa]
MEGGGEDRGAVLQILGGRGPHTTSALSSVPPCPVPPPPPLLCHSGLDYFILIRLIPPGEESNLLSARGQDEGEGSLRFMGEKNVKGQEQSGKPIVASDSRYPARKEAGGTEGAVWGAVGGLHNIGAAVYCQVFTLSPRWLKGNEGRERGQREEVNDSNPNGIDAWKGANGDNSTPAMTHSLGRSCHRAEGVVGGEERAGVRVCTQAGVHVAPEAPRRPR